MPSPAIAPPTPPTLAPPSAPSSPSSVGQSDANTCSPSCASRSTHSRVERYLCSVSHRAASRPSPSPPTTPLAAARA
eukprot:4348670-Prymnesium_polylepis.1